MHIIGIKSKENKRDENSPLESCEISTGLSITANSKRKTGITTFSLYFKHKEQIWGTFGGAEEFLQIQCSMPLHKRNTYYVQKGSCRISIVRWARLFGYTLSPHWNAPRRLLLCSHSEPMDRNHLGQCTALFNGTECEQYW